MRVGRLRRAGRTEPDRGAGGGGPTTTVEEPGADHNDAVLFDGPRLVDATARLSVRVASG
jgi:hypothetical protein